MGTREVTRRQGRSGDRDFRRLDRETPDEARDEQEQGWMPELLAAGRRHLDALRESLEWAKREQERLEQIAKSAETTARYPPGTTPNR
jgi:hypothetical protein